MATQFFTRSGLLPKPQQALASLLSPSLSFSSAPASAPRSPLSLPSLLRPLSAASAEFHGRVAAAFSARCFTSRSTSSWLNDPTLNCSNCPPKVSIHPDDCDFKYPHGCDLKHWNVVIEKLEDGATDDEYRDSCFKTLAHVVGSEEEARMKIYAFSVGYYYIRFSTFLSEELSYKLSDLPTVHLVCPDVYNGVVEHNGVPDEPEDLEEWVGNNARANERKRRDDRARNFGRSRNFERRGENMQNRDFQARDMPPVHNQGMQNPPPQGNMPPPSNFGRMPPPNQVEPLNTILASSLHEPHNSWSDRHTEEATFAFIMFPDMMFRDDSNFEHWLVVMKEPEGDPTRDEIIDSYIKTLAQIVGSEEEARMRIYFVDTGPYYFAFAAFVSEEISCDLDELPRVLWVIPDSYLPKTYDYRVPDEPVDLEAWEGNNARANERNGRDDRPRNFDRPRDFEKSGENMRNRDFQAGDMPPMHNQGMQNPPPQGNMPPPSNFGGMPLHNQGVLFIRNIRMYTYDELLVATEGFGSVYKGTLEDGTSVAIKVLST